MTTYIIIAEGEAAQAIVIATDDIESELHEFMCFCKKPWRECQTAGIRSDIEEIFDDDFWTFDDAGARFHISWSHECGKIHLYVAGAKR